MARTLTIGADSDPALAWALEEIQCLFPWRFKSPCDAPLEVSFHCREGDSSNGWSLERLPGERVRIVYRHLSEALRALGILMGEMEGAGEIRSRSEETPFQSLGVMLDVSRNGVLRVDAVRALVRHFALMGINRVFLYMEDTYEIPGEPLFGYFRGRYTAAELKAIDDDAALFQIEVVPFIQTLGHLRQVLQWPAYGGIQDTADILLTGSAETEALVEKMLVAATSPFRSRRVHLGMDEAHGVGTGNYRLRNGFVPPFEIVSAHLERISGICERLGLSPMVWSDMFFRLESKTEDYYDREAIVPTHVANRIPSNVDLVYWDYYHTDPAFYTEWIERHRAMGREPLFATGAWTWNRFWTALPRSFATLRAGMSAARKAGLKEAFITLWGDDGAECSPFSALPAIQYFADLAYSPAADERQVAIHFRGSCNADSDAWIAASGIDYYPALGDPALAILNTGKWLLWHDPLLSFLDCQIPSTLADHYERLASRLRDDLENRTGQRLEFPCRLAEVLVLKVRLHLDLRPAYRNGDLSRLASIARDDIPALLKEIRGFWKFHRAHWHAENKPFGWENIERRYGGLLLRLETLRDKLSSYLNDPSHRIEELENETHPVYSDENFPHLVINHRKSTSPSMIN